MQNHTTDFSSIPLDNLGAVTGGYHDADPSSPPKPDGPQEPLDRCYWQPKPPSMPLVSPNPAKPASPPTHPVDPIPLHGPY